MREKERSEKNDTGEGENISMGKEVDRDDGCIEGRVHVRLGLGTIKGGGGEGVTDSLVRKELKKGCVKLGRRNTVKSYVASLHNGSVPKIDVVGGVKQVSKLIRTYQRLQI